MAFVHPDIRQFLIDSIPSRFSNLSPSEFESFVAFVFQKDGYEVEELSGKGGTSGNLIARKAGSSLVIHPLRYPAEQAVNISQIQHSAAARTFYETDQSWIITTSSFTTDARNAAEEMDIELWDWKAFYEALSQMFFEGKDHTEFIKSQLPRAAIEISDPGIRLKAKWQPEEGIGTEWYNLDLAVTNPSTRNIYIHLDLPALIDGNKNQVFADQWAEHAFVAGMIYSGASVRTNALFKSSRLGESPPGGKIMLTCHERTDPPSTYHLSAKLKGSACYFVTHCYGSESYEYAMMIKYRDTILAKTYYGRAFIMSYYFISPAVIKLGVTIPFLDVLIRKLTKKITGYLMTKL